MVKYIAKANDDVLSHCRCDHPLAAMPAQADCPWCGCGWMICCLTCGKGFVFARVVETDASYEELSRRNFSGLGITDADIAAGAEEIEQAMASFEIGDVIVYLDGSFMNLDETEIEFDGIYAHHKLEGTPHAGALTDPDQFFQTLTDPAYWYERERGDRLDDR